MSEPLIFHIDVNSAFLSWEATRRVANGEEDLRLIPSCIGGDPQKRTGIVVAKSIPAKKYGITTGEPMSMALRKCPNLVCVKSDFKLYEKCSRAFKAICKEYAPCMESFSIDEVFLDMTGTSLIYPDPVKLAYEIKDRIRDELGFTVNVGIGRNKLCAKMASDFEKPDKVHTLWPEEIPDKMWPLPVGDLFTCGKSAVNKLSQNGIHTIEELANSELILLKAILGENTAIHLHEFANGIDTSKVSDIPEAAKGYSAETTVDEDLCDIESINKLLMSQADIVSARMRLDGATCGCVGITFKTNDFSSRSHQKKLTNTTDVTREIYETACKLMHELWKGEPLRLVGLSVTDINRDGFEQMYLFDAETKEKQKALDSALDSIRGRYGNASVKRASTLGREERSRRFFN